MLSVNRGLKIGAGQRNTAVKYVRMLKPRACDLGARGNRLHNFHRNK